MALQPRAPADLHSPLALLFHFPRMQVQLWRRRLSHMMLSEAAKDHEAAFARLGGAGCRFWRRGQEGDDFWDPEIVVQRPLLFASVRQALAGLMRSFHTEIIEAVAAEVLAKHVDLFSESSDLGEDAAKLTIDISREVLEGFLQ